ncbi:MAG: FAD-binding oxidoreductase [Deltaproteobacteria bacterium]|nr:FAD-binding oxidoreductase [Deltaproteobacteria bacterium]
MGNDRSQIARRLHDALGNGVALYGEATRTFAIDGSAPAAVLYPATVANVRDCLAVASELSLGVVPVGNGTQLHLGHAPRSYDAALSLRSLRRVVAHETADMTVTVEAGCTLAELNARLSTNGQWLPLDPPCPEHTTVGALIATDAWGPSRFSQGKVRDLLIGISAVLADGRLIHGGGRVVKNVAGYDLMKLFTGSFGTLGVITEATFKVRPRPQVSSVLVCESPSMADAVDDAVEIIAAPLAPLYVTALNPTAASFLHLPSAAVCVGIGGSAAEVAVQEQRLQSLRAERSVVRHHGATATRLLNGLRDLPSYNASLGARISLLPTEMAALLRDVEERTQRDQLPTAIVAQVGSGVAHLRCGKRDGDAYDWAALGRWLRQCVAHTGGHVVFDRLPPDARGHLDPWGDAIPGFALMRGIKQKLDPRGILSPGRFVGKL